MCLRLLKNDNTEEQKKESWIRSVHMVVIEFGEPRRAEAEHERNDIRDITPPLHGKKTKDGDANSLNNRIPQRCFYDGSVYISTYDGIRPRNLY